MTGFIEKFSAGIFAMICHQQSALLLLEDDRPILLCPRCIGLEMGFCFAFFVSLIVLRQYRLILNTRTVGLLISLTGIMLFDFLGGWIGFSNPSEYSRLITGSCCGAALGFLANRYRQDLVQNHESYRNISSLSLIVLTWCSVIFSVVVVAVSNWIFLTSLSLVIVLLNVLAAAHSFSLLVRIRLLNLGEYHE
jgi:hypothetical protein